MQNKENTAFQARHQDSVTRGADINFEGHEKFICVNSRGARGNEKFIPVWIKWTRWRTKIQRDFPAEIRNSNVFSGRKQVIPPPPKKGLHWNCKGFSGRNRESKRFFRPKTSDIKKKEKKKKVFIPKMSWNPVSVHKNYENTDDKYQFRPRFALQKPRPCWFLWGAVLAWGRGTIFVWGGTSSHLGGARPRNAPPWRRVCRVFSTSDTVFCTGIDSMI